MEISKKINVLLIQVDQLPWFALSIAGSPNVRTPNIDALAREGGVLFDNATCQSPICLPSRVSMLAGRYVSSVKQFGFDGYCERDIDWMQTVFKRAGYITGAFGKFHALSVGIDDWNFDVSAPTLGEDEDYAHPAGNTYRAYCKVNGVKWPTDQMHGHDPFTGDNIGGKGDKARLSSHADRSKTLKEQWSAMSDVPMEHSLERWTSGQCIRFIDECGKSDTPFFAWLTFDRPHYPTTLPKELYDTIRPEALVLQELPDAEALTGLPRYLFNDFAKGTSVFSIGEKRFRFVLATYYALIEYIDSEIGRVINTLKDRGAYDDTLIIFTADHGDEAGYNGLYDKNRRVSSEAITRIPIIMRPPKGVAKECSGIQHAPIENIDIFSTACAVAGLGIPSKVEGRDLSGFLSGEKGLDMHRPTVCEDYWKRMIKKDGWKLIFDAEEDSECLLYNMNNDTEQFRNRYRDISCAMQRMELKREIFRFLSERIFGTFTQYDIDRIERGLDENGLLPVLASSSVKGPVVHFLRAGAVVQENGRHQILVRFYNDEVLLFPADGEQPGRYYRTRRDALAHDDAAMERLMDIGIRYCMRTMPTVSLLLSREPIDEPVSTQKETGSLTTQLRP